ncbi:MAG: zinc dependent phospholipase C family protein [Gemmatimonadota bacterium]|nr:MAG: zinc dependent phospholipase C family protein [Gemmatimonadota bacterium]
MGWLRILCIAGLAILLVPDAAWAWGPGMHILVGTELLGALSLLPAAVADILRRYPLDFLYGSIAADMTFGKKYAPVGRNCHHWHVGEELYEAADSDATRACALGYLTHLAGDTIAHNFFLPRKLLTSANTQAIGHSYWEHRLDIHLGQAYLRAAFHLLKDFDHSHSDRLMDRVLDRTVFSFQTNRLIFKGMITLADHGGWRAMFDRVLDYSRWDVDDQEVGTWLRYTFEFAADYLIKRKESVAAFLDPTGERALGEAKMLNRIHGGRKASRQEELSSLADEWFTLPGEFPGWWGQRLGAEGMWIDLVHLKAILIRPKQSSLTRRKKGKKGSRIGQA